MDISTLAIIGAILGYPDLLSIKIKILKIVGTRIINTIYPSNL